MIFNVMTLLVGLLFAATPKNQIYYSLPASGNDVALTFDDGPSISSTEKVLKALEKNRVKATFFVLGENLEFEKGRELLKKIVKDGHEVGIHSMTHPNFHKLNKVETYNEILNCQNLIYKIVGFKPTTVRPPYGIVTKNFLEVAEELKLKIIIWTNDSLDWKKGQSPSMIVDETMKKVHPGSIILMHDKSQNSKNSLQALPIIIKKIRNSGYAFELVSNFF